MPVNEASSDSIVDQCLPEIGYFDDFIGREKRISALDQLMKKHRLITLVGPGGMGKTRLAREVFNRDNLDAGHNRAIAFVNLELVTTDSEEAVLDALASDLNLILPAAEGLRPALVRRLSGTPMLLMLDNCETAHKNVALLVTYFLNHCPNLRIIATSQHQLSVPFEKVHEVLPLSVPNEYSVSLNSLEHLESYQLLLARVRRVSDTWIPDENSTLSLRRILQLTDGIPLAIEIVAAWAPFIPLEEIRLQLSNTLFGSVTAVDDEYCMVPTERHRSMLLCLEWSLKHLSRTLPNAADCFRQLGVFEGRFTEDAVGKICQVAGDPRKQLIHLAKTSFVHICPGTNPRRYKLLNFYREFAREKAREEGLRDLLSERYLDYYLSLIQASASDEGSEQNDVATSWEEDWPDLIAVANAASALGKPKAAWIISSALSPFLKKRGLWFECERLNRAAVKAADVAKRWPALVRSLLDLGIILDKQGRWPEAAEQYQKSLYFATHSVQPNPNYQAMALQYLGSVLTRMGKTEDADRIRMRYMGVSQLLAPRAKARAHDAKGKEFQDRRDFAKAEAEYREAFRIRNEIGDAEEMARSKSNLGIVLTLQGDAWPEAEKMLRESLDHWVHEDNTQQQAIVMHLLADMLRRQGRKVEARQFCGECLKLRENDPKGRAVTLSLLAKILVADGKLPDAIAALSENLALCHSLGDSEAESIAYDQMGAAYMQQNDWDKALDALGESRKIKDSPLHRDAAGLGLTLDRIAQVYARRGEWGKAQATYSDSLRYSLDAGKKIAAVVTQMNLAMMYAAQGLKETALKTLDDSIASLKLERFENWFLNEARNLRSGLDRNMREGIPWVHWRDAAFKSQQYEIRKQFDRERRNEDWLKVVSGYKILAESFIESGQQMEAALALNELGGAYRKLPDSMAYAEGAIRKALAIFDSIPLPLGQGASWHKLADLFAEQHQWLNAEDAYNNSIKFKQNCFDEQGEAISQDPLFDVLIKVGGRLKDAERAANRSWEIMQKLGTDQQKWYPLVRLLRLKVEQNNPVDALSIAKELSELTPKDLVLVETARDLLALVEAGNWNALKIRLSRNDITKIKDIPVLIPTNQELHDLLTVNMALQPNILPQEALPQVYVSYAWGEDTTVEGRQREEIVNLLCNRVRATSRRIGRDKDSTVPGDSIEEFTQKIAKAPRIIAVISAKSLHSEYCMVYELYSAFLNVSHDAEEFRKKLIPIVMKDAEPMLQGNLHGVEMYWKKTYQKELNKLNRTDHDRTNIVGSARIAKMGDMCRQLSNMLHVINDTIMPRGFDVNIEDNFEAVIGRL